MASAEQTKASLIQAVIRLLNERSATALSVRDIAREAGVNHGLVHRYFGSKDTLIREAISETTTSVHTSQGEEEGLSVWSWSLLRDRPEVARILARCCLDGPQDLLPLAAPPQERLETYVKPVKDALERFGLQDAADPYLVNAICCAALLGWVVFRPFFDVGYGIPADSDARLEILTQQLDAFLATLGS